MMDLSLIIGGAKYSTAEQLDARQPEGKELRARLQKLSKPEKINSNLQHFLDTVTLQEINSCTKTSSPTVFLDEKLITLSIAEILNKGCDEIQVRGKKQPNQHYIQ